MDIKQNIENGQCSLGIELGSTRIKAVLIGESKIPIAIGFYDWENTLENGVWTYSIDDITNGLQQCYSRLKQDVFERFGVVLSRIKNIGISAMMHGYMAFDSNDNLLTPFRTWRNTITEKESKELTELFDFPIAQRWTISHFLKDIKDEKKYLNDIVFICTLASFVHYKLTGEKTIGIGDASGMFPIDCVSRSYDIRCVELFNDKYLSHSERKLENLFPKIKLAGECAGELTKIGALILDPSGDLESGSICVPPEGDAETGMMATNSIAPRSGNISAGTSAFAMIVLEKPLTKVYRELDIIMTPDGKPVAMSHSNNCTSDYDSWISLFSQVLESFDVNISKGQIYDVLLEKSLLSDPFCSNILSYGYVSGEHITGFEEGRPILIRYPDESLQIGEFMRSLLYSAICTVTKGLRLLVDNEDIKLERICGHGGFFKNAKVGGRIMSAALAIPVSIFTTAGEGGAWGMALLADYASYKDELSLSQYLSEYVFHNIELEVYNATKEEVEGFESYFKRYKKGLPIERSAIDYFKKV